MNNNTNIDTGGVINEDAVKEKYLRGNKAKLQAAKTATVLMIIAAILFSWFVYGVPVNTVSKKWVYDKDGILNDITINAINSKNAALFNQTGSEIVVVVEKDSSSNANLPKRAEKLFKDYKVSDTGVLFIVAVPTKDTTPGGVIGQIVDSVKEAVGYNRYSYAYQIGRNVNYSLDSQIDGMFNDNFKTDYNSGNYNAAVMDAFNALANYFEQYYNLNPSSGGSVTTSANNYNSAGNTHVNQTVPAAPFSTTAAAASSSSVNISSIFVVFFVLILAVVLVGKLGRRVRGINRGVYTKPSWFGTGLGLGLGLGLFNRRNKYNNWGSFFNNSSNGRNGGAGRNSGGGFGSSRGGGGGRR